MSVRFEIERHALRVALEVGSLAQCADDLRPHLAGTHFRIDDALTATSTDGHRLVTAEVPILEGVNGIAEVFIDRAGVKQLLQAVRCKVSEREQVVTIEVDGDQLRVSGEFETVVLQGRDEIQPPYGKVIPPRRAPKDKGPGLFALSPAYLADVRTLGRFVSPHTVAISVEAANKAVRFDSESGPIRATYVIMPVRF